MRVRKTPRSNEIDPSRRGKAMFEGCVLVAFRSENPYKSGSEKNESFELLLKAKNRCMTFEEYQDEGGRNSHIRDAVEKGYVLATLARKEYSVLGAKNGYLRRAVEKDSVRLI